MYKGHWFRVYFSNARNALCLQWEMQLIQFNTFAGYNMWVFRQGLKWSLNCGASQALSRFPHMVYSPALSCLQVRQISGIHTPPKCLISLGRQLPWSKGIHDITWPGSWVWQLGDQNKRQCHALFLPDSVWPLWLIKANSILRQSLKTLSL